MNYTKENVSRGETMNAYEIAFFNEEKPIGPMQWKVEDNLVAIMKSCASWLSERKVEKYETTKSTREEIERSSKIEYGVKAAENRIATVSTDLLRNIRYGQTLESAADTFIAGYLIKSAKYG